MGVLLRTVRTHHFRIRSLTADSVKPVPNDTSVSETPRFMFVLRFRLCSLFVAHLQFVRPTVASTLCAMTA